MGQNSSKSVSSQEIDHTESQKKETTFMNDSKINALHQTLSGNIGIAHSFTVQIEFDDFKEFINQVFTTSHKNNCITVLKESFFTPSSGISPIRPHIHLIPRFDDNFIILTNKKIFTDKELTKIFDIRYFISIIASNLAMIGLPDKNYFINSFSHFFKLFTKSIKLLDIPKLLPRTDDKIMTGELHTLITIKPDINTHKSEIEQMNISGLIDSTQESELILSKFELLDDKIMGISNIYNRRSILYSINLFSRVYDITAHISIVEEKLKELTTKYINLLDTANDNNFWIFLFNYLKLHPFNSSNGKIGRFLLNLYFIKHYNFYIDHKIDKNRNFFDIILCKLILKNYIDNYIINDKCTELLLNNNLEEYRKLSPGIFKCSDSVITEIIREFNLLEKTNVISLGGGSIINYKTKYLKYKTKYLELQQKLAK